MGAFQSIYKEVPLRAAVPEGKLRVCVSGFTASHHTGRARVIASHIAEKFPEKYESWFYFASGANFRGPKGDGKGGIIGEIKKSLTEEQKTSPIANHKSSPFCWLEFSSGEIRLLGGRDRLCDWVVSNEDFSSDAELQTLAKTPPRIMEAFFDQKPGTGQPPL